MHEQLDNKNFRHALAAAGFVTCLIFLVASAIANYRYAYSLARTPLDGYLYGAAAAAGDVFMAAAPFYFRASVDAKRYMPAVAAVVIWFATTLFAAQAVVSHASANRLDAASSRATKTMTFQDTRTELAEARKSRGFIPAHRDEGVVKAEINKAKIDRQWTTSNECVDPAGKAARTYCSGIETLNVELGYAMQASKLDKRISSLVEKSDKAAETSGGVVLAEADSGAHTWAMVSGLNERTVQTATFLMVAFVILTCAGLGPYMVAPTLYVRRPKVATIDAVAKDITPAVDEKAALEAALVLKALPKPNVQQGRAEPTPEWRALLTQLDYPKPGWTPERDGKGHFVDRKRDADGVLGLRFFTWLVAHNETGQFAHERIDELYAEFTRLDFRTPVATRVVKAQLSDVKKWVLRNNTTPVTWIITAPPIATLKALLVKRRVLTLTNPTPQAAPDKPEVAEESGAPFPSPDFGAPTSAPLAAPANDPKPVRKPMKGLGELSRYLPDLEGMRRLERVAKHQWQARVWASDRKQRNRMSRARAA